ncbi:hypothetical protein CsSME_00022789 [Camellia sinensis var. sinensis]
MRLKPFSAQRGLPFHRRPSPATIRRRSLAGKSLFVMLPDFSSAAFVRRSLIVLSFFAAASFSCFVLYKAADSAGLRLPESFDPSFRLRYVSPSVADDSTAMSSTTVSDKYKLERVLKNAAMKDGTVILTTLNEAWAAPNSIIDLFLESFRIGYGTHKLLNHLVIIALDEKAFSRCLVVHNHCFSLFTEGANFSQEAYFMTPDYLKMMWRRIDFLRSVLEMGYNFVFTVLSFSFKHIIFLSLRKQVGLFYLVCSIFYENSLLLNLFLCRI